jgi:hypothetical protein
MRNTNSPRTPNSIIATMLGTKALSRLYPRGLTNLAATDLVVDQNRISSVITSAVCEHLERHGFAVVDGVFGTTIADKMRDEIVQLQRRMHTNCTHLVDAAGQTQLVPKQHIREADGWIEVTGNPDLLQGGVMLHTSLLAACAAAHVTRCNPNPNSNSNRNPHFPTRRK